MQDNIANHLKEVVQLFPEKPKAIVVISAHNEANPISITSSPAPGLLFDYSGFPPASYLYSYDPPQGDPDLAQKIKDCLSKEGVASELDDKRKFDHGVFVPLMLMYPKADIPVVSVSLHPSLDPKMHMFQIGKALSALRQKEEGVLILGSGYTYHNMEGFFHPDESSKGASLLFNDWLKSTIIDEENFSKLVDWEKAPGARACHPREEHLLPLLVVAGACMNTNETIKSSEATNQCSADETKRHAKAKLVFDSRPNTSDEVAVTGYLFDS